jgi:hypothetical protein
LAIDHGLDISFYKERMDEFKNTTNSQELQKADAWAKKLIYLYGVNSHIYRNKKTIDNEE